MGSSLYLRFRYALSWKYVRQAHQNWRCLPRSNPWHWSFRHSVQYASNHAPVHHSLSELLFNWQPLPYGVKRCQQATRVLRRIKQLKCSDADRRECILFPAHSKQSHWHIKLCHASFSFAVACQVLEAINRFRRYQGQSNRAIV